MAEVIRARREKTYLPVLTDALGGTVTMTISNERNEEQ